MIWAQIFQIIKLLPALIKFWNELRPLLEKIGQSIAEGVTDMQVRSNLKKIDKIFSYDTKTTIDSVRELNDIFRK
jgi:hypothetical protein